MSSLQFAMSILSGYNPRFSSRRCSKLIRFVVNEHSSPPTKASSSSHPQVTQRGIPLVGFEKRCSPVLRRSVLALFLQQPAPFPHLHSDLFFMFLIYTKFTTSQASQIPSRDDTRSSETNSIRYQVAIIKNIRISLFVIKLDGDTCFNCAMSQNQICQTI